MKILAIETSCDETCAAVVDGLDVNSSVISSQIDLHKQWGGVVPIVAKRAHEEKIEFVVNKALEEAKTSMSEIGAIAVTQGPGLAIALGVGLSHAIALAKTHHKPLIATNHIEGHVVGSLTSEVKFPALSLVVSGGHTELIYVQEIGNYKIVARTMDDALGESLDKAARMLGLGYPGGAALEKEAKEGNPKTYDLPRPLQGKEDQNAFSYSGLKAAMWRLVEKEQPMTPEKVQDLSASFQTAAFNHLLRVVGKSIQNYEVRDLLVGGGVAANSTLRLLLQDLAKNNGLNVWFPKPGMSGDNAAMIGIAASFKADKKQFSNPEKMDRLPRWQIDRES